MSTKHTPGPWQVLYTTNARRIVACVNACEEVRTENLEQNRPVKWLAEQHNAAVKQRDELRDALQGMLSIVDESSGVYGYHLNGNLADWDEFPEVAVAQAAISKATGEPQ